MKIIAAFALCFSLLAGCCGNTATTAAIQPNGQGITIVIDPGHGGADSGASSANGLKESEINLQISERLNELCRFMGVKSVMTRETDCHLGGDTFVKSSDLKARLNIARSEPESILVSIHQNHFSDPAYGGAQVFYGAGDGSSLLADTIQENLRSSLDTNNHRQSKYGGDTAYILKHFAGISVLVECGFLSNPGDEARLQTKEYQLLAAASVLAGVLNVTGE